MGKFKPGDRVVCVNDVGRSAIEAGLHKGAEYVLSFVEEYDDPLVHIVGSDVLLVQDRFELAPTTPPEPQCQKLNTPITEAVTKVYEAVLTVPEKHRSSILRAVLELL